MAWDEARKAEAVKKYQAAEPTPANSMEIVKEIADEMGETANGVRAILTKAEVYIKKDGTPSATAGAKPASTRVSKESSHADLTAAIEAAGHSADSEIISKLTGKAAVYFTGLFKK